MRRFAILGIVTALGVVGVLAVRGFAQAFSVQLGNLPVPGAIPPGTVSETNLSAGASELI